MGLKTKIEYLKDGGSTHNFWSGGCNKISPGCQNCFAERIYKRFYGKDFSVPILSKNFDAPLKWKKPRVILVNDMSDFFYENVPHEWKMDAMGEMAKCAVNRDWHSIKRHIFLLLTKRPENMVKFFKKILRDDKDYKTLSEFIWLGVSVENQKAADERIPELLKIPHFKKWISVEPMLENIDMQKHLIYSSDEGTCSAAIDWLVCGAETGNGARPMQADWARDLSNQCKSACVPFFMKQMSGKEPIPNELMVREYPPEIEAIRGKE